MADIKGYNLPDELYYHKEHAWVRVEEDGLVTVGMNDFYQQSTGDVVYIDLPFEGDEVEQGDVCGKVQSSKWVGKLCAPVSGRIEEVNYDLDGDATIINQDCYGDGWIVKINPSNLEEDLKNLYQGDSLVEFIESEVQRAEAEKNK